MGSSRAAPTEVIQGQLALYLGPHTAKVAVRTFAERALKLSPEQVTLQQAPQLLDALLPMLRTLMGAVQGEALVKKIKEDLS